MSFSADIRRFAEKTESNLSEASRNIKIKLFDGIIMKTRVGNSEYWKNPPKEPYTGGRLRGNWQTSTGQPKYTTVDRIDPNGTKASAEVVRNVTADGVDYMTNNLPYAKVYEEKDGMVAKNMARIERTLKEAVRDAQS